MEVAIINYNAGNIFSVVNAVKRLGITPVLTNNAESIQHADKVIFPGQGEAATAMSYLVSHGLNKVIKNLKQPVLGICIGQQLLCRHSEEGNTDCLGIFNETVKKFTDQGHQYKIPAIGWNNIHIVNKESPLLKGIADNAFVYFVHSYYVPVCANTIATSNYATTFSAALQKDNFFATQFHPEKSGDVGERILQNFIAL